jgi:arsenate reductase-like glutaredoxin family protein
LRIIVDEYHKNCDHCKSQLAFLPEDVVDTEFGTYVVCPACKKAVNVTRKELPKNWESLVKWEEI